MLDLPLAQIASLQINKASSATSVLLRNGDKINGTLKSKSLPLVALFGEVTIPTVVITDIQISPASGLLSQFTNGLVLYYSFDTDDGNVVHDQSGNGNDGKVMGAKFVTAGATGGAMSFNGQSDYIRVPNSKSLETPTFTISVWAKTREAVAQLPNRGIIGKLRIDENRNWYLIRQRDGLIGGGVVGLTPDDYCNLETSADPFVGKWGYAVLSYDGNSARFYVNGELVSQHEGLIHRGNSLDLMIGADGFKRSSDEPEWLWNGFIDEMRIYNRALMADEVRALYKSIKPAARMLNDCNRLPGGVKAK